MPIRFAGAPFRRVRVSFCLLAATALAAQAAGAQSMVFIAGSPPPAAIAGEPYQFQPQAFGGLPGFLGGGIGLGIAREAALFFAIDNLPSWASFSPTTGTLAGTPGAGDAGVYSNIVITATNGFASAALPVFSITVSARGGGVGPVIPPAPVPQPGSLTLSWLPPTENTDGSPLTDLTGYRIYSGREPGALKLRVTLQNPGLTRHLLEPVRPEDLYFAISAVNSKGTESDLSGAVRRPGS